MWGYISIAFVIAAFLFAAKRKPVVASILFGIGAAFGAYQLVSGD